MRADPNLEVVRADEVAVPGAITSDIITRLMHSDLVVADITYPNPNVFYELGLRHACKAGTIIIRERNGPAVPFDIAHLRHIEYENTATGLKQLSDHLRQYFELMNRNQNAPDSQFLELAKLTHYEYPDYKPKGPDPEVQMLIAMFQSPQVMELLLRQARGEEIPSEDFAMAMLSSPSALPGLVEAMVKTGQLTLPSSAKVAARGPAIQAQTSSRPSQSKRTQKRR